MEIEGTTLLIDHRGVESGDRERLECAAGLCVDHGLVVQGRKVLQHPVARDLVPNYHAALREMVG